MCALRNRSLSRWTDMPNFSAQRELTTWSTKLCSLSFGKMVTSKSGSHGTLNLRRGAPSVNGRMPGPFRTLPQPRRAHRNHHRKRVVGYDPAASRFEGFDRIYSGLCDGAYSSFQVPLSEPRPDAPLNRSA